MATQGAHVAAGAGVLATTLALGGAAPSPETGDQDVRYVIVSDPSFELPSGVEGDAAGEPESLTAEELARLNLPEGWQEYTRFVPRPIPDDPTRD
ncbi:hypothetical protein [Cellulomonas sp.]|uniref:hypothetical protein n=1 Tax=Cellulomonas sp. TaxID=40001 RepID=UPI002586EB4D|nr:hypothetical protein [Cellulomonas sp.]MCR6688373.1 hypothetical protein [Cellulomonas sp.]